MALSILSDIEYFAFFATALRPDRYRDLGLLVFFCMIFGCELAYSQTNCDITPPVLKLVSVQPETGWTEIRWDLSPAPDISAYLIYVFHDEQGIPRGDIVDTIWNPAAKSSSFFRTSHKYFSESYVVAAYTKFPKCTSKFSNDLSTIFAVAQIDTCNKKITINWNSYLSSPVKVLNYSVLAAVNGSALAEISNQDAGIKTFSLNNFTTNAEYCFVIRANLEGGSFSTSNKACISTKMQRPPQWINADFATVTAESKINLFFTFDKSSQITNFRLEKKSGDSRSFQQISNQVSNSGNISYTDDKADISMVNSYRLSAINNCGLPVTVSNIATNIVLSMETKGKDLNFSWNRYKEWLGNLNSYTLFVNSGNGFRERAVIQPEDTLFTIGYDEIMYEVSSNEVCFYLTAEEKANPYNINGQSISSNVCIPPTEIITSPNVFTPNSGNSNAWFRPVLSFTPKEYILIVSNRSGKTLFETKSSLVPWDGTFNGETQPPGVYLWFLKVITPSGKSVSRTGTVTIINR